MNGGFIEDFVTIKDVVLSSLFGTSDFVLGACNKGEFQWKNINAVSLGSKTI